MAVYFTLLKPGDTVMGLNLSHGGHLTHGHPINFSGKLYQYRAVFGQSKETETIDYDELLKTGPRDQAEDDHRGSLGLSAHARFRCFPPGVR